MVIQIYALKKAIPRKESPLEHDISVVPQSLVQQNIFHVKTGNDENI